MGGGGFNCTTPLLLYPSLFLVLFFSFINYRIYFFPSSSSSSSSSPSPQYSKDTHICNGTSKLNSSLLSPAKDHFNYSNTNKYAIKQEHIEVIKRKERALARARFAIREAARNRSYLSSKNGEFLPKGSIYIDPYAFHQSHTRMEKLFRIWVYKEGEPPLFHKGPLNDIYSIEGQIIDELGSGISTFLAKDPKEALAFFVPVSIVNIVRFVYRPYTTYSRASLQNIVKDYIDLVSRRYPFWNTTKGADHFLVSCHDWAPDVSAGHPVLFQDMIRVLCNANASEGFQPTKDVSLPEIKIPYGKLGPPSIVEPLKNRSIFAFFAGGKHGDIRERLLECWKGKDSEIQVYEYLPKSLNYFEQMGKSMYCLCPSGYEVASPRIVESISAGCVPVIISENYVLPFSDVLDWSQFSVHVPVEKIPNMKEILKRISREEYVEKQRKVIQVQRHFQINRPSKPYDLMHMVMHSVWLRRLNIRMPSYS